MSVTAIGDARAKVSEEEWRLRVDLACCYRLVEHFGMADLVYNHITARLPYEVEGKEVFLINGFGRHYTEITASNLIRVDIDGKALDEDEYPVNGPGYVIHSAIHKARHDVGCIIHTHSRAGCAVAATEEGLIPLDQQSLQFHQRVAYHELEGIATDVDEQDRLLADLGDKNVFILRNHGLLACGRTVAEAFRRIYYLERACRLQVDVMSMGLKPVIPSKSVAEHTARQWEQGSAGQGTTETIEWPALSRLMTRKDPSFALWSIEIETASRLKPNRGWLCWRGSDSTAYRD